MECYVITVTNAPDLLYPFSPEIPIHWKLERRGIIAGGVGTASCYTMVNQGIECQTALLLCSVAVYYNAHV